MELPGRIVSNFIFNILKSCQTVAPSGYIILCAQDQYMRFPISAHPRQPLFYCVFFIVAILVGLKFFTAS